MAACERVLAEVFAANGYPLIWPDEPIEWLSRDDTLGAWVAVSAAGGVVGHVMVRDITDYGVEVSRLFVSPTAQSLGFGAALLDHAVAWAAGRGLALTLCVESSRTKAIALYERTGWYRTHSRVAEWRGPDGAEITLDYFARDKVVA